MHDIEVSICLAAREKLENRNLRIKDLYEWLSGPITAHEGETVIEVDALNMHWWVAVPSAADFRGLPAGTRGRGWPPRKPKAALGSPHEGPTNQTKETK